MAYLRLGFVNWGLYGPSHHQQERRHHCESGIEVQYSKWSEQKKFELQDQDASCDKRYLFWPSRKALCKQSLWDTIRRILRCNLGTISGGISWSPKYASEGYSANNKMQLKSTIVDCKLKRFFTKVNDVVTGCFQIHLSRKKQWSSLGKLNVLQVKTVD